MKKAIPVIILLFITILNICATDDTPDKIVCVNGKVIDCRITNVDSLKIDLVMLIHEKPVTTYLELSGIASYTYNDITFDIQPVQEIPEVEPESKIIQPWKMPYYPLHSDKQPESVARLNLFVPGLTLEGKVSESSTIILDFWLGFEFSWTQTNNDEVSTEYLIVPSVKVGYRNYINLSTRISRGKRVDYYSGTYVQLQGGLAMYDGIPIFHFGGVGGYQQTMGKKGYWNIEIGPAIAHAAGESIITLVSDFTLGFIISK